MKTNAMMRVAGRRKLRRLIQQLLWPTVHVAPPSGLLPAL